jgi:hypothetical protein
MSKSIWHKPSEITDTDNNLIIKDFVNRTYEIGWFDDNDMIFKNFRNSDTYDKEGMMKWCDVDDIVNDYERLQTELERTRKALEVALDWLGQVATPEKCDDDLCREFTKRKLAEIKTALEQRE